MRVTPFSVGRRWYCGNVDVAGNRRPPFTFVIIGPGHNDDHRRCRLEYDRVWLECCGYSGMGLTGKLESLADGMVSEYNRKHLRKYATLVEGTPVLQEPKPEWGALEHCCRCQKPTPFWTDIVGRTPGEQVALCPECSLITHPSQIPTKRAWCDLEKARHPKFTD
jgi:hypothetical protein